MERLDVVLWQERAFPGAGLLDIAMGLRQQANGSADPWPEEKAVEAAAVLNARLRLWSPPVPGAEVADGLYALLVRALLKEAASYQPVLEPLS
jgi:hypothetical protein